MIFEKDDICPMCGGCLQYYDKVNRLVRGKGGKKRLIKVKRYKCLTCFCIHRQLPNYILPFKQYEAELIIGVIEKLITSETLGYEDYPCELTMKRWNSQYIQSLL